MSGITFIRYSKSKDWKGEQFKVLGAIKPKGLNRIAKFGQDHIFTREQNFSFY
jgi:hypothetical protein